MSRRSYIDGRWTRDSVDDGRGATSVVNNPDRFGFSLSVGRIGAGFWMNPASKRGKRGKRG